MIKPALAAHFALYADYHRHPVNRLTHKLAIPLIVFHVIAMLGWVVIAAPHGHPLTLAHLVYAAVVAWYLRLDVRLGILTALLYGICFPLAEVTSRPLVLGIAAFGWLVQLAGHVIWEKRSPAFFTHFLQALIGPLFFVATWVGLWPAPTAVSAIDFGGRSVR
jgi:uncharacterized membrane protein YGL010W